MKTCAQFVQVLLLFCCSFGAFAQQGMPPAPVNVVEARNSNIFPTSWIAGVVVSQNDAKLATEVNGRLIYVAEVGDMVKKGQKLAQIDDQLLRLAVAELEATVESAQYNLRFLSAEVKRKESLVQQSLSAQNDLEQTRNSRDMAKAQLTQDKARLATAKARLGYTTLLAPFDGVVTARLSNLGEVVASGTEVVRLVETANLEVTAQVPITASEFMKKGAELVIKSPLGEARATVKAIVPVADERSHLMEVRLALVGTNWPVGLNVRVAVPNGPSASQLVVPRDAVVLRRGGNAVFRINDENKAERVVVSLGAAAGELIAVLGDLKPGDKIVIRGAERLQPGQTVAIKDNNDALVSLQRH